MRPLGSWQWTALAEVHSREGRRTRFHCWRSQLEDTLVAWLRAGGVQQPWSGEDRPLSCLTVTNLGHGGWRFAASVPASGRDVTSYGTAAGARSHCIFGTDNRIREGGRGTQNQANRRPETPSPSPLLPYSVHHEFLLPPRCRFKASHLCPSPPQPLRLPWPKSSSPLNAFAGITTAALTGLPLLLWPLLIPSLWSGQMNF